MEYLNTSKLLKLMTKKELENALKSFDPDNPDARTFITETYTSVNGGC